jgi:hypothetical protein
MLANSLGLTRPSSGQILFLKKLKNVGAYNDELYYMHQHFKFL